MSLIKAIDRLRYMHTLIRQEKTGNPKEFANKLSIARSTLYENLDELKILGAPIKYSRRERTFYYCQEFTLRIEFQKHALPEEQLRKITGSKNFPFFQSRPIIEHGVTGYLKSQNDLSWPTWKFCRDKPENPNKRVRLNKIE